VLVLVLALATGCQVRITGGIDVDDAGGGTVRAGLGLDADALETVGDLGSALRVDDLRQAGWSVDGPRKEGDGLTWVRVTKRVSDSEEAATALAQLSGPEGPFRDLRIESSRDLLHTRTSLSGAVDLSGGLNGLADADLLARIGGTVPLDLEGLRTELGADLDKLVQVSFEARLPGSVHANTEQRAEGRLVWRPPMGERLAIAASSQGLNLRTVVIVAIVLVVAVGGGITWFVVRRRRR